MSFGQGLAMVVAGGMAEHYAPSLVIAGSGALGAVAALVIAVSGARAH
jgi:hypothetical protein